MAKNGEFRGAVKAELVDIRRDIEEIKIQVYNHLPTKLGDLDNKLDAFRISNQRWLIGILVTLLTLLGSILVDMLRGGV